MAAVGNISNGCDYGGRMGSRWSIASQDSVLSIASRGSVLSIGSIGSCLSIGSIGSLASVLSIGTSASAASVMSAASCGSVMSAGSFGAVQGERARRPGVRAIVQASLIGALAAAIVLPSVRALLGAPPAESI